MPEGLPAVAPFNFALLPETLRPWAEDICERVQCPSGYVGATIMAALGSVLGRKVGIRPQAQTDWTKFPNQWALIVGRPGVLKSPAMEVALSPLKRLAAPAVESHRAEMEEYQQAARLAKLRAEAGEKAARAKLAKNPTADVSGDLALLSQRGDGNKGMVFVLARMPGLNTFCPLRGDRSVAKNFWTRSRPVKCQ